MIIKQAGNHLGYDTSTIKPEQLKVNKFVYVQP